MAQITRADLEKLGLTKTTVTIGELLGIANKAASMDWDALSESFSQATSMEIIKKTSASALVGTFKTVLNAFGIGVKVARVAQKLRPIINLVVKIAGLWSNPALLQEIVAEAAFNLKSLILSLAITGVNYAKNLILAITIDLGFLLPEDIEKVTDDVDNAINDGYVSLENSINSYVPDTTNPDIDDFVDDINNAFAALEMGIHSSINNASSVASVLAAVNGGLTAYSDSSKLITMQIYGTDQIPNTGGNNNYYYGTENDILSPTSINLDEIQNGKPVSDGDTTYLENIQENTRNTNLLLDEIEKNIQYNKNRLLDAIRNDLQTVDVDISEMETRYPEEDVLILRNFKDSLIKMTRDTVYNQASIAFETIFDFTEDQLKKLLALYAMEFIRQLNFNMSQCLFYTNAYISGLNVDAGNTSSEYIAQLKAKIISYLNNVCKNKPDPVKIFQKVIFDYLSDIFNRSEVSNQSKQDFIKTLAMNRFYYTKEEFSNNIKDKIRNIRMQNDVIDSTYYTYSYNDLYTLISTNITSDIQNTTASTINDFNNLIADINNMVEETVNVYQLSVTEEAHPTGESIKEKMGKMRTTLFYNIRTIILEQVIPSFNYEDEYPDISIEDKAEIMKVLELIYSDYRRKLIDIASTIIIDQVNPSILVPTTQTLNILMSDCITEQDMFVKAEICKNIAYGMFQVSFVGYSDPLNDTQKNTIKTNIQNNALFMLNSTNLVLKFPERFSAILKEQEVKLILGVVDNLNI